MTKKELIKELAKFPNDAEIIIAYVYEGNAVIEGIMQVDENGGVQLTAESLFNDKRYHVKPP